MGSVKPVWGGWVGADGLSRKAIRDGGLWKFLTVRPKVAQKLQKFAQKGPKKVPKQNC